VEPSPPPVPGCPGPLGLGVAPAIPAMPSAGAITIRPTTAILRKALTFRISFVSGGNESPRNIRIRRAKRLTERSRENSCSQRGEVVFERPGTEPIIRTSRPRSRRVSLGVVDLGHRRRLDCRAASRTSPPRSRRPSQR
jgi:hypothetical protein